MKAVYGSSFVKKHVDGELSLLLHANSGMHMDVPGELLPSSPRATGFNSTSFIYRFDAIDRAVMDDWNEKPMLVKDVQSVNSPNGFIPSVVRLYLVKHEIEKAGIGDIYFSPRQDSFKLISRRINRELSEISNGIRHVGSDSFQPSIVKGAFQIVDSVPDPESDLSCRSNISDIMLDDFIAHVRINLDAGHIGVFKVFNALFDICDVMVGPFNFKSR